MWTRLVKLRACDDRRDALTFEPHDQFAADCNDYSPAFAAAALRASDEKKRRRILLADSARIASAILCARNGETSANGRRVRSAGRRDAALEQHRLRALSRSGARVRTYFEALRVA